MDFTDILKSIAPTAATMLGGPVAGFAVKYLADKLGVPEATQTAVTDAMQSMTMTPEGRIKLAEIDASLKNHALDVGLDYERLSVQVITEVNKTMQAEDVAEHWPSYGWRPYIGFCFGTAWIGCYFVLPAFHIPPPVIPSEAWLAVGGILGVASWFRGKAQADPNNNLPNKG
jgi:hypothetical protein